MLDLLDRFHQTLPALKRGNYNETEVRVQFINPLFEALGWDMTDRAGRGEVKHEDKIAIAGKAKAPDYGFYLDGRRRFFVEAKKPAVNLAVDSQPAFQLRRYAWTAKLPLSVLTDFEEFAVYDTRVRPRPGDAPTVARLRYWRYDQYADQWADIAALFSRDAVLAGSLEQFAAAEGGKKGIATVDAEFLGQLNEWRDLLARAIANRNPGLSGRDLNFAVQQTLDRLIFLRIAEDRAIEPYGRLRDLATGPGTFDQLLRYFYEADNKYNSGLFHLSHRGRGDQPDMVSPRLTLDDKPLKEIIRALYEPISPYEFSVFPADILGQVYEQFLGHVIRLDLETGFLGRNPVSKPVKPRVIVEEKPEVRKAGGVYYTPTYIVEYIVRQTVGRLVAGHTPDPTGPVARLRVLDPACGSGSFLLGAYQFLLDWHLAGYLKDVKKWSRKRGGTLFQTAAGDHVLTLAERRRILLANLYGVDIDPQAVEVTKLSLLLKVLEGAAAQLGPQAALLGERVLPDLDNNVKCGNSLIGPEFYERRVTSDERRGKSRQGESSYTQPPLLGDDELLRVNAFDWRGEFRNIMANGGFDAVIGNPPYIRIQALKEWAPLEVELYKQLYRAAGKGNYDIYVVFVEKALSLLNERGRLGFILPHKFFNAKYGEPLRGVIAEGKHLSQIVHFGDQQVFAGATTYTCLLFLDKSGNDSFQFAQVRDLPAWRLNGSALEGEISADLAKGQEWNFSVERGASLFDRLSAMPTKLEDVTDRIFQGIKTSADKIYIVEEVERDAGSVTIWSPEKEATYRLEPDLLHPLIKGGDSKRYHLSRTKRLILFPYALQDNGIMGLIPEKTLKRQYPLTWTYLLANKQYLENREHGKMRTPKWYGYVYPKALDVMSLPKNFTPDIAPVSAFSVDDTGEVFFTGGVSGGYGILVSQEYSHLYMLGLLNSRLLQWLHQRVASQMRGGWYSYEARFIKSLPIRTIDFTDLQDVERHDRLVALVQQMLDLHRRAAAEANPQVKTVVQRQIDATDKQIDRLVYGLYGLTAAEVGVVEGAG